MDAQLGGQANYYKVNFIESVEKFTFIKADIKAAFGGEIDWTKTAYADELDTFDGPRLEALLWKNGLGERELVEYQIGATDLWYVNLYKKYAIPCALLDVYPMTDGSQVCEDVSRPKLLDQAREDILLALNTDFLLADLHNQPSEPAIDWIRLSKDYAFVTGKM